MAVSRYTFSPHLLKTTDNNSILATASAAFMTTVCSVLSKDLAVPHRGVSNNETSKTTVTDSRQYWSFRCNRERSKDDACSTGTVAIKLESQRWVLIYLLVSELNALIIPKLSTVRERRVSTLLSHSNRLSYRAEVHSFTYQERQSFLVSPGSSCFLQALVKIPPPSEESILDPARN